MAISPEAQAAYDALSAAYGQPLDVISGYRSPEYNRQVGGASNSQHTHGNAFDINVRGMPIDDRLALASQARDAGFRGFGFYDNTLHFDVGPSRYWGPSHYRESTPDWARAWAQENIGGAAPQGVPSMAMTPDPQPQGFMSNLFGGFSDAPDTSPTDPYANLSRQQRMMLGFAALRDAGASFAGRDTDFFAETLGGYESARDRERLRRQGELQNRAAALQGLAQIQQQIAIARARGVQPSDAQLQLEQYFTQMLTSEGGGLEGAAPMVTPDAPVVTPAAAAVTPAAVTPAAVTPDAPMVTPDAPMVTPAATAVTPAATAVMPAPETPAPEVAAVTPDAPTGAPRQSGLLPSSDYKTQIEQLDARITAVTAAGGDTQDLRGQASRVQRLYETAIGYEREDRLAAQEIQATPEELDMAVQALARMQSLEALSNTQLGTILGPFVGEVGSEDPLYARVLVNRIMGEEGAEIRADVDQIVAEQFLQAFDRLKGGGQITDKEGDRALKAKQQLTARAVSPEAYRQAIVELRMITENLLARSKGDEAPHSLEDIAGGVTGGAASDSQTLSNDAAGFLGLAVQQ